MSDRRSSLVSDPGPTSGTPHGFAKGNDEKSNYERMKAKVNDELKKHFRPEFLNRIDDIVVFHQLTEEQIITMVDLMITRVEAQLANKDMAIELTPAAKALLARRGFDPVLGARPLRRTIQREIEDQLSEKILFGEIEGGQIVIVDVEGVNPDAPEGSRAADDKAKFTFRGEPKPAVMMPDAPPISGRGGERASGRLFSRPTVHARAPGGPPPCRFPAGCGSTTCTSGVAGPRSGNPARLRPPPRVVECGGGEARAEPGQETGQRARCGGAGGHRR